MTIFEEKYYLVELDEVANRNKIVRFATCVVYTKFADEPRRPTAAADISSAACQGLFRLPVPVVDARLLNDMV